MPTVTPSATVTPTTTPTPGLPTQIPPTTTPSPTPTPSGPTPTFPPSLASLRIAYTDNGKLWLWHQGRVTPLTEVDEATVRVRITDDGQVIAFRRQSGLWAINRDGSGERLLVSSAIMNEKEPTDSGISFYQIEWLPGTHVLFFNTIHTGYGLFPTYDLQRVNADTQRWDILLPPGKGGFFYFSPDRKKMVLVTATEIHLMDVDGSHYRTVFTYPYVLTHSEWEYHTVPDWAPDSKSFMVPIPPSDYMHDDITPTTLWRIPADGSPATVFAEIEAERGRYISLSPDLSKMVIQIFSEGVGQLHIANSDGSGDVLYASGIDDFYGWSPDMKHFAYRVSGTVWIGALGTDPIRYSDRTSWLEWLDGTHFLYEHAGELRLGFLDGASILLVGPVDFAFYNDYSK
jgi:hypothetical protein